VRFVILVKVFAIAFAKARLKIFFSDINVRSHGLMSFFGTTLIEHLSQ
jgi:hypothetical protein